MVVLVFPENVITLWRIMISRDIVGFVWSFALMR